MGPRSKIKKTRKSITMINKGKSSCYYLLAVLGICIACLPLLIVATQLDETLVVGASDPLFELDDLEAAESQNMAVVAPPQTARLPMQMQASAIPASAPAPSAASPMPVQRPFAIPKSDLASAPSYAPVPRYAVPPVNPYRERLPYEVANFRRRAQDEDGGPPTEDDYVPSESKGKKSSPGILKRFTSSIRNTGKAIVGAPSFIYKRYRGTWKKYFGGGKKKKGGWKSWSPSDKADGWGWEESEPTSGGGWDDYPPEKGWKSSKGWAPSKGWDSHERRYDRELSREPSSYRERDVDYYDRPEKSRPRETRERERPKYASNYREESHYDDYDGHRTKATYGPSRKTTSRRPSSSYRQYDDDY